MIAHLEIGGRGKFLIVEKVMCFLLRLDLESLRFLWIGTECCHKVFELPRLDIVVALIHTVDVAELCKYGDRVYLSAVYVPFDSVALITNHKAT